MRCSGYGARSRKGMHGFSPVKGSGNQDARRSRGRQYSLLRSIPAVRDTPDRERTRDAVAARKS
jgi:hypothetical protein